MQSFAVEGDFEIAASQSLANRVFLFLRRSGNVGRVGAAIPEHDGATTVLSLWDRALESVVVDGMIFDLHRESLQRRVETRTLRNGPALHHSVQLETEIEVEVAGSVLLDHEPQSASASGRDRFVP